MKEEQPVALSVIIPAYNEVNRIGRTLCAVGRFLQGQDVVYEILVVDDGCRDETAEEVERLAIPSVRVLSYGANQGKGYAVNFGVKHALGRWILFCDADNSTPIEELAKLWKEHNNYQVIIGSRYTSGSKIVIKQRGLRVIISRLGNLLTRLLILPGISDTQCGFKLFEREAARMIFAKQTIWRWGFDMEILRIAKELGYRIKEVPVTWQNNEASKIQSSRVFSQTLLELLTIKKNSLFGRYHKTGRSEVRILFRFALVGIVGTSLDYGVLNFSHLLLGVNLFWAVGLGFLAGAGVNYWLNSLWSFGQRLSWRRLGQFLLVAIGGWLLTEAIISFLVQIEGWHYNIAKLISLMVVFLWNYLANRSWTFKVG